MSAEDNRRPAAHEQLHDIADRLDVSSESALSAEHMSSFAARLHPAHDQAATPPPAEPQHESEHAYQEQFVYPQQVAYPPPEPDQIHFAVQPGTDPEPVQPEPPQQAAPAQPYAPPPGPERAPPPPTYAVQQQYAAAPSADRAAPAEPLPPQPVPVVAPDRPESRLRTAMLTIF